MFYFSVVIIFLVSFLLSLRSLKTINEKPKVSDVKKSRDKTKIIEESYSSS
jgi:hypothetical protein